MLFRSADLDLFEKLENPRRFAGVLKVTELSIHTLNGGFRVNVKVRQQLRKRKRKLLRRISVKQGKRQSPMIRPTTTKIELAEKQQAVTCGGIAAIIELVKTLGLRNELNKAASVLKVHLPYDEADHILNIALNLLAGGTCLDHIEHRRNDEAYLDALGAERIPDPTTAGDFCRRFSHQQLLLVMQAINRVRQTVWKQQEETVKKY